MREDAFVSRPYIVRSTIRKIPHKKKKEKKQQLRKAIVSCFYIFLKSQGCPVPINDKFLSTAQDLTHPLYHNVHSVCIHQFLISVSFFYVFNKLEGGISTLALYIAWIWHREESAEKHLVSLYFFVMPYLKSQCPHYDV